MKGEINIDQIQSPAQKATIAKTIAEDLERARTVHKQREADEATKRYRELTNRIAAEDRVVASFDDELQRMFDTRFSISIPPARPLKKTKGQAEEAVLVISDSHIGKIVLPEQTLGFGDYNLKLFFDRLYFLEQTVIRLIQENIHNPVQRLHILFLGDLVEGMLEHSAEIPMRELVAPQVLIASLAYYQFIARISRILPVTVRGGGVVGNHGRWGTQKKCPTENRFSNFDYIVMGQIEALCRVSKLDNVEMKLEENAFQVFDIFQWRFKVGHGDHLKGGDKQFGIPAHAIGREVNTTTQRYAALGKQPPDFYIIGDKHRHISLTTARGRYMVNGAWFDVDGYAMGGNFPPGRPFQMFFGMHPRVGKTWSYDVFLDAAPSVSLGYDLPAHLRKYVK